MKVLGFECSYINEGNAHVILQLNGTEFALRIIKDGQKPVDLRVVENALNFISYVMHPLLSDDLMKFAPEVLIVPAADLGGLRQALIPLRPENRKNKSDISRYAIQTDNFTLLDPKCETNYCIEIKPKEGFMSSQLKPLSKCYYCLKQYLKLEMGEIQEISSYCPLDLFSANKERMRQALMNLFDNPQNNIKLFENGRVIYGAKSTRQDFDEFIQKQGIFHSIMQFLDFIIEILLKDIYSDYTFEDMFRGAASYPLKKNDECVNRTDINEYKFRRSCLYRLYKLQKLTETKSFELQVFEEANTEYVDTMIYQIRDMALRMRDYQDREKYFEAVDPVHAALISAVAKDCSIMISFSPNPVEDLPFIKIGKKTIPYRICVTDLGPKTTKSLLKRRETEMRMIDIYKNKMAMKIQPNTETRAKQLEAWEQLIAEYMKANKQSTIDIREVQNSPLFNNTTINRKLSQEAVVTILEDMAKTGRAAPVDKSRTVWEVYWHSLDEWGNMVYNWASGNGMTNSVCTLFELREGENTSEEEFHGLDMNVLVKALKALEAKGKCELMEFDDNQGVKFF